jgi:NarL family two-component system sensor histidine kinase LiaS
MSFLKRFSSLQWKLAVSYVVVTLLTVLALEGIVILAADRLNAWAGDAWVRQSALGRAGQLAELAADPLATGSSTRLAQVLNQPMGLTIQIVQSTTEGVESGSDESSWDSEARVVIGAQGRVVASNQPERYPAGSLFAEPGLPEAERLVAEALADGVTGSLMAEGPGVFAVAVPVTGAEGARPGAVYYRQPAPDASGWSLSRLGMPLLTTTLLLLPCMIPLGLIFGFTTATGLTRRLRRLTQASSGLAGGDLSRRVHDSSGDEIGQLARQFNAMAGQLEADTTQLRELADRNARLARQAQKLAALEERHRLARDLHDGVKQHLFSVNLATAAALNLLDADPEAARARLLEARELSRQAQAEMQALLNELRPVGLDERGLVAALTNVARHAQAARVTVELRATPEAVTLRVADDGRGFDPAAIHTGSTMGLQGMRERLARLGGTLTVDAVPGAGTRLVACLPRPLPEAGREDTLPPSLTGRGVGGVGR